MGQTQQQNNPLPARPAGEDILSAQKKANRKKRLQKMQEIDLTEVHDDKPEEFLKQFIQTPGQ